MSKFFLYFVLIITISSAWALDLNKSEARAAAFMPISDQFRDLYGDVGLSLQVEQARGFQDLPHMEIWGNFEWIFFNNTPHHTCGTSRIDMLNISLGLKGIEKVYRDFIYLYAGIGPNLGIVFIENQINCSGDREKRHSCNLGVGAVAKSGLQLFLTSHFYLSFFIDYLYLPVQFQNTRDVGGFKIGGGLSGRY